MARIWSAIVGICLVTAACSSPGPPPATPAAEPTRPAAEPTTVAPPPTATTPAAAVAATRSAASTPEATLRLPLTEPPTLDPGLSSDSVSVDVVAQLFEGLVGFDSSGKVFGLGAEKWEISPDGLTYTFTLRDGPRWSDGKPVVAKDYEWAWKRNIDPNTASDYATTLYPLKNAVKIHKEGLDPEQLGVEAKDDRTLVVTLEQPAAYFLRLASTWTLVPLRSDIIARYGDKWTEVRSIVTNGPFLLKEWQHDVQLVLERNEHYWGEKPSLGRAIYRIFPEGGSEQVLTAYEAGELDTIGAGTSFEIPAAQIDRILADPRLKQEVKTFPESATMFITVNTRRPHLRDPRVRIALGQAIERDKLLTRILKRTGEPATSLQPPGILGRRPDLWPKEDLEQAKQNLADAGFPEGRGFPEISFTFNTSAQWKLMAEYLQERYNEALGVKLKLDSMEWATFLKWRHSEDWHSNGDLFRGGWFSDYEDPNNWYNVLWDSREDPGVFNTGWRHDEFDTLVRKARGELDAATRERLYQQAEEILAREYPSIPVFHYSMRTLVKPHVDGFEPDRILGITPLRKVKLGQRR